MEYKRMTNKPTIWYVSEIKDLSHNCLIRGILWIEIIIKVIKGVRSSKGIFHNLIRLAKTIPYTCHAKRRFNFQKCSEHGMLLAFWLPNVLRAATSCTSWTSELEKVLRTCGAFTILISKRASRHNGVRFFHISTSKSAVTMMFLDLQIFFTPQRCALFRLSSHQLASVLLDPLEPKKNEKNTARREFPTFSRTCICFLPTFFFFDLVSASSPLCFSICPYRQKFDFWTSFDEFLKISRLMSVPQRQWHIWWLNIFGQAKTTHCPSSG